MKLYIKFDENKDKDLIDWICTIDKEARSYMVKSILRKNLKLEKERDFSDYYLKDEKENPLKDREEDDLDKSIDIEEMNKKVDEML